MAFTTNMSTTTQLDAHLITMYENEFLISAENTLTAGLPSLATQQFDGQAKTFTFPIYSKQTVITSALTQDTDVTSVAMADAPVAFTPLEYGNAITTTKLAVVQSGGLPAVAAVRLMGVNMRESVEKLMVLIGEAGTNEITAHASGEGSMTSTNILSPTLVKRAHNKLVRAGIPGPYYMVAHDDVLYDLKNDTGTDSWTEINTYTNRVEVVNNEIGMFGGFRVIHSPQTTVNADAGSSTTDSYHTQCFGQNAFGYAASVSPNGVISGPFDKLQRFANIGWYGIFVFGLVDTAAHWLITSASSIGNN